MTNQFISYYVRRSIENPIWDELYNSLQIDAIRFYVMDFVRDPVNSTYNSIEEPVRFSVMKLIEEMDDE